ncbi:hypothetical protein BH23PLA1_BH23PLA1_15120 [soil metagenome]
MGSDDEVRSPGLGHPLVRGVLFLLVLLALALLWRALPVSAWVDERLQPFLEQAGAWGYLLFGLAYVIAVVLLAPGAALTLSGGYLFGPWIGLLLSSISATTGASASFLIGRYLAREPLRRRAHRDPRFRAIDRAVADRGAKVVLLLRLSPVVPFNLLNYALGLTGIRLPAYILASGVGMLLGTAVVAFIGSSASGRTPGNLGLWGWLAIVLTTLAATVYIALIARRALAEAAPEAEEPERSEDSP